MEQRLPGGRNHGAVRVRDTVRRPAGNRTPAGLAREGVDGAFDRAVAELDAGPARLDP